MSAGMTALRVPHAREHESSVARRAEQGRMPRTLPGLLNWYLVALAAETPERLHKGEVWRDRVSASELGDGVAAKGGSHLGSPALADAFRRVVEGSASETDEDGWYRFPVRAALSRMRRRRPLMARFLVRLGQSGGDVAAVADALGWPQEMMGDYAEASLRRLWTTTYDRTLAPM